MYRKLKVLIARWLARRIEMRNRRTTPLSARLSARRVAAYPSGRSPRPRPAALRRMVSQRERGDTLRNNRAIAAVVRCRGAGE